MTTHDLIDHIRDASQRRGLTDSEEIDLLTRQLKDFSKRHRALIRGVSGERRALRTVKSLNVPHAIISNLEVDFEGQHYEFDQIVFTENSVFSIEVKNLSGRMVIDERGILRSEHGESGFSYGLGSKCVERERYLWETLAELGFGSVSRSDIHSIILFADRASEVCDKFGRVSICFQDDVCYFIQEASEGNPLFSPSEIGSMASALAERHSPAPTESPEEFSLLRSRLEKVMEVIERPEGDNAVQNRPAIPGQNCEKAPKPGKLEYILCLGAGFVAGAASALAAAFIQSARKTA